MTYKRRRIRYLVFASLTGFFAIASLIILIVTLETMAFLYLFVLGAVSIFEFYHWFKIRKMKDEPKLPQTDDPAAEYSLHDQG